ncbi:MAG: hypothetical protein J6Q03_04235 [Paludibacteraceae bacterium]|nr:hypothetical protein [Paludibacteraceae bacterium]
MRLIKREKGLSGFYLWRGQEVLIYRDKILIGDKEFETRPKDDFFAENDCLTRSVLGGGGECQIYNNGDFEDEVVKYGARNHHFSPDVYYSKERDREKGVEKYSFIENGQEYLFEVETKDFFMRMQYVPSHSILILPSFDERQLHFYTKTGERLWVYEEKEIVEVGGLFLSANEEIFESKAMKVWRSPSVVDDVVVIVSHIMTEGIYKALGFKIRTGEKLWELRDEDCPNHLFEGDDKMLYGCLTIFGDLILCRLDPFTGKFDKWVVKSDKGLGVCSWNVSMHNNRLYYGSNRPGCEFGIIDCGKKELVESVFLDLKKGYQIGAPIVSDGKVYVFGGGELRVYEL